jgi:hypothetical protein
VVVFSANVLPRLPSSLLVDLLVSRALEERPRRAEPDQRDA